MSALQFIPYPVMCKRLGAPIRKDYGGLNMVPLSESIAHEKNMDDYYAALREEQKILNTHICMDWDPSDEDDPFENPPTLWCPACKHKDELDHRKRSQQLIVDAYMAEYHPKPAVEEKPHKHVPLMVTPLQASAIQAGGVLGIMTLDMVNKNMRPFWYYCELDDPHWLDPKPAAPLPPAPAVPAPAAPAASVPTFKVKGDAAKRQTDCAAWMSTARNKRLAYFDGHTIKAGCLPKDNSIVLKNLPLESPTLEGDMRELIATVAPVVDIYRPRSGGMFIGLLKYEHVDMVLAAYKDGILYRGNHVRFEAALSKSKSATHYAATGGTSAGASAAKAVPAASE